jgi:hypothetical protein
MAVIILNYEFLSKGAHAVGKPDLSKIKQALYIKLGRKGLWEPLCLADGTLRLGYYEVPDGVFDKKGIADIYKKSGTADVAATNHGRQVADFYAAGPETLWITFSDGYLWWAESSSNVEYLGASKKDFPNGSRLKRTLHGWSNKTLGGKPLIGSELSGKLTRSASYRQTICAIKSDAFDYLLHKIKDKDHPTVREAKNAKAKTLRSIEELIAMLTPQDFELFVDLLFSSSGWRRVDVLGGTKKTVDIDMMLPLTNERACIQIKSKTSQPELDGYIDDMSAMPADRIFYVYHTATTPLTAEGKDITLLGPGKLAESALRSGLLDWLIEKVG